MQHTFKGKLSDFNGNTYEVYCYSDFVKLHSITRTSLTHLLTNPSFCILKGFYNPDFYQFNQEEADILEPYLKPYLSVKRCKNTPFSEIAEKTNIKFMTVKFYYCYFCEQFKNSLVKVL